MILAILGGWLIGGTALAIWVGHIMHKGLGPDDA